MGQEFEIFNDQQGHQPNIFDALMTAYPQQQGLTRATIKRFHQFEADESLAGDRCSVCQDDIEVGRRMMRLDCGGQHVFCQTCVEGWFADHNTCPNCRHVFH